MGWDYLYNPPRGVTAEALLRRDFPGIVKIRVVPLRPRAGGDPTHVAYAVMRHPEGSVGATVFLIDRRNGSFGYKAMTEDMGPYEVDFPAEWLAELDPVEPGSPAADWRESVMRKAGVAVRGSVTDYGGE